MDFSQDLEGRSIAPPMVLHEGVGVSQGSNGGVEAEVGEASGDCSELGRRVPIDWVARDSKERRKLPNEVESFSLVEDHLLFRFKSEEETSAGRGSSQIDHSDGEYGGAPVAPSTGGSRLPLRPKNFMDVSTVPMEVVADQDAAAGSEADLASHVRPHLGPWVVILKQRPTRATSRLTKGKKVTDSGATSLLQTARFAAKEL
ncbi:hypothetical protein COCNU_scaffold008325G000020 [Cocos nucifera]|nr:hypothetical protein [Cocos nucifera]